ncbi:MAG: lactate utilization protein [Candidatus Micrarchaeota archaeon]|nr:lactate utilization protein [Candidatus Micrarchaeota archaeon]
MVWNKLADDATVDSVAKALEKRGMEVYVVDSGAEAKKKFFELIPDGAEVLESSSTTLNTIGVTKELEQDGKYDSVKRKLHSINNPEERNNVRRRSLGAAYGVGSVQAVTEDGRLVTASASGSQIATYAFSTQNVVLVVGTQKIVKNLDEAFKRIYEHALPLESKRVNETYGWTEGSYVGKLLVLERDRPGRTKVILVKEKLGF